ncbi:SWI5-dependent HO expression protein 2 [Nakaseomyces bracarensis]|uniref:SWI5-dependent HO expression protein 2 n=1 Tax=Nakaseomyces bracarensis TaxID=273131 RepID=A0ABR4NMN3_9SACH
MSEEEGNFIEATDGVVESMDKVAKIFSAYLSSYIHVLNKYINNLRRVTSLRNERAVMIKYVKKLRFYNDTLLSTDMRMLQANYAGEAPDLAGNIETFIGYLVKVVETIDLVNYFLTQPLQKEIIAKTLNVDLAFPGTVVPIMEDTYNYFVKFTQWSAESLSIDNPFLAIEVVEFTLRCAEEDQDGLGDTDNIFLQEIIPVQSSEEYEQVAAQWADVLAEKLDILNAEYELITDQWHKLYNKTKN